MTSWLSGLGLIVGAALFLNSACLDFDDDELREMFGPGSSEPAWSPDGKQIAYISEWVVLTGESYSAMCSMNEDGSGLRRLVQGEWLMDVASPDWSPDGTMLIFRHGADVELLTLRDGTSTPIASGSFPAFSPDGRSIAMVSEGAIHIVDSDGPNDRIVTSGEKPAWSPDGSRLVFSTGGVLFMVAVDGSSTTRLVPGESPDWSPDGKRIAFSRPAAEELSEIWTVAPDGSNEKRLTSGRRDYDPAFSPDSSKIAYQRGVDIYTMKSDGSKERRVNVGSGACD